MTGLRCGCGAAIDCTYPKCKEGVEMSQSITQMLRDYARDYTTTTYHDALIRKAATEIEFHEERWDQLRQRLAALRDHQVAYETETEQQLASRDAEVEDLRKQVTLLRAEIATMKAEKFEAGNNQTIFMVRISELRQQLAECHKLLDESKPF